MRLAVDIKMRMGARYRGVADSSRVSENRKRKTAHPS